LPEERLQAAVPHLEDDGEAAVPWSGRLADRFTTHRQKLATGETLHGETRITLGRRCALVAVVAALAAGCGGSDETSGGTTTTDRRRRPRKAAQGGARRRTPASSTTTASTSSPTTGLKRAERELGIKGRVVEANSAADYVPNMTTLRGRATT
jgi:hypothetical protein